MEDVVIATKTRSVRSISQAIAFFKIIDPETAVKYSTLKRAVDSGDIPHVDAGTRKLIVLEDAYEYFYGVPLNLNQIAKS